MHLQRCKNYQRNHVFITKQSTSSWTSIRGFSFRVNQAKEFKDDELLEGELILSGKGVGAGYLNDEEKTQESFIKTLNNLGSEFTEYKTGDVVAFDRENQQLWFKGRKDYQVKVNGFRVELEELDAIANTIEGVTQLAVL